MIQENTYNYSLDYVHKAKTQKGASMDESGDKDKVYPSPFRTDPNNNYAIEKYNVNYSNPFSFPSYSSYRNLLANKYDEGDHNNNESSQMSKKDKERLIEEIKEQVRKEREESYHHQFNNEEGSINEEMQTIQQQKKSENQRNVKEDYDYQHQHEANDLQKYESTDIGQNNKNIKYNENENDKPKYESINIHKIPAIIKQQDHAEPSMKMNYSDLSIHNHNQNQNQSGNNPHNNNDHYHHRNPPSSKSNLSQSNSLNINPNPNPNPNTHSPEEPIIFHNQLEEIVKENEHLRMENIKLKKENEHLLQELNNMKVLQYNNNIIQPKQEEEETVDIKNDEFKNYLIQENNRLTKALKERYSLYTTEETTIPNQGIIRISSADNVDKVIKKKKKKMKKKRSKSKKEFLTIQTGKVITTQESQMHQHQPLNHYISNKRSEYDLYNSERVKTCIACLMGSNKFSRGYSPKDSCYHLTTNPNSNRSNYTNSNIKTISTAHINNNKNEKHIKSRTKSKPKHQTKSKSKAKSIISNNNKI